MKRVKGLMLLVPLLLTACEDKNEVYSSLPQDIVAKVEAFLPLVEQYVHDNQKIALELGEPLSDKQLQMASRIGITYPDKVRIHYVEHLPRPENESLLFQFQRLGMDSPHFAGITYGHGIWIKNQYRGDKLLLAHELIHVRQVEEQGLTEQTRSYLLQLMIFGYKEAPDEVEAYTLAPQYLEK